MSVQFYLDSRCNRHGENPIRASFSCKGVKWVTSMGINVNAAIWERGRITEPEAVNGSGLNGREIQQTLDSLKEGVREWERTLRRAPTVLQLQQKVRELMGREADPSSRIRPALNTFIREQAAENQWAASTVAAFRSFGRHLERFDPGVTFESFDADGIGRWLLYLRNTGMEESTVRKEFQHLRWFVGWAARKGYTTQTAVCTFKPKFKIAEKPVVFLTRDELLRLWRFSIPSGEPGARELEDVRNCFCFCAFTSLRFSDMAAARWSDIENGILYITTQKTFERLPIDLCTNARAILRRYPRGTFADDRIFPPMSNRKMNECLRRLCRLCRIDAPVTKVCRKGGRRRVDVSPKYALMGTHAARRTFICFALSNGIPPQVVMKWTGHSDYKSMKPYIDIAADTRAAAMRRLERRWEGK